MKDEEIQRNLEMIAHEQFRDAGELWPAIRRRMDAQSTTMASKPRKMLWALVPVGVLVAALLAYLGVTMLTPAKTVSAAELLAKAEEAKNTPMTSFHGVVVSEQRTMAGAEWGHTRSERWYVAPNKFREDAYVGIGSSQEGQLLWVSNGESGWSLDTSIGKVHTLTSKERDITFGASSLNAMLGDSFQIQSFYNVQVLGTESVAGRTAYIVDLTIKPSNEWPQGYTPGTGDHVKFWLDSEYFFILKFESYDAEGNDLSRSTHESFEINGAIDPAVFEVSPPQ